MSVIKKYGNHVKRFPATKIWQDLRRGKDFRKGYVESQLEIEIPFQIQALRKARKWSQAQLAEKIGCTQAWISKLETPGNQAVSLRMLYRVASAFDIAVSIQFVSFSEMVRREENFDPNTFNAVSFKEDSLKKVKRTSG